jgi:hypothetical protein
MERTFAVRLTIPDNEAFTALATLQRVGIPVGQIRRADIWTFDVDAAVGDGLAETIASIETIFNSNKHELIERSASRPLDGEVWIAVHDEAGAMPLGERRLPGVTAVRRRVGWQLLDASGRIVETAILDRAVETFLCNSAFQKAIR